MKKVGIYTITCLDNRKIYVGLSKNIHGRWADHRFLLRKGLHKNPHLQSAWNLYGEKLFSFAIIEECSIEQLEERERYWMDRLGTLDNSRGYNMILESKVKPKPERTNIKRETIHIARQARKPIPCRKVVAVDLESNEATLYDSYTLASEDRSIPIKRLQECLASWSKGKAKKKKWSIKNIAYVYLDDYNPSAKYSELIPSKGSGMMNKKAEKKEEIYLV